MFEWYTHLCDYHNVTPEKALKLGTRADGRKPDLPGSETCKPVSNMTMEDIWSMKERKDIQSIFDFYKDQGAWSTFRQCVRHKDLEQLHLSYFDLLIKNGIIKNNSHVCEYGCGVAPFVTTFLKYAQIKEDIKLNFTLVDVDCDHFNFAKYRLNKIIEQKGVKDFVTLNFETVKPDQLPSFNNKKLDVLFCFEVLEHVPSPVKVIENIRSNMNPGAVYIENFIKHDLEEDEEDTGCDLKSARDERNQYYTILEEYYNLVFPSIEQIKSNPNTTKIWQRNSL